MCVLVAGRALLMSRPVSFTSRGHKLLDMCLFFVRMSVWHTSVHCSKQGEQLKVCACDLKVFCLLVLNARCVCYRLYMFTPVTTRV